MAPVGSARLVAGRDMPEDVDQLAGGLGLGQLGHQPAQLTSRVTRLQQRPEVERVAVVGVENQYPKTRVCRLRATVNGCRVKCVPTAV